MVDFMCCTKWGGSAIGEVDRNCLGDAGSGGGKLRLINALSGNVKDAFKVVDRSLSDLYLQDGVVALGHPEGDVQISGPLARPDLHQPATRVVDVHHLEIKALVSSAQLVLMRDKTVGLSGPLSTLIHLFIHIYYIYIYIYFFFIYRLYII